MLASAKPAYRRSHGVMVTLKKPLYSVNMQSFLPQKILIESKVVDLPLTQTLRRRFSHVPIQIIENLRAWKEPAPMSSAKRVLAIAEAKGEALKPFPRIRGATNLEDYVFNLVSNCHLECTYCILQSYLKNNPVLTVFANTEHFFEGIRSLRRRFPDKTLRLGTGELSDSLAIDDLTALSREFVPFFAEQENLFLELKTKSDCIDNLLHLKHRGHTVLSWSLSPESIVRSEELKCAPLEERLQSARRVQALGYPVGLHLDPMIYHEGWQKNYRDLIAEIAKTLDPRRIAWVSIGSLRFDKALKEIATERFPHSDIFSEEFILAPDGKLRYFKTLRREMYRQVWRDLAAWDNAFPRYLCMEAPWMWEEVTEEAAPHPDLVEARLTERLKSLADE